MASGLLSTLLAIDEICEHAARSRIPVDFTRTLALPHGTVVCSRATAPPARAVGRPSPGVARPAIASRFGWLGLAPYASRRPLRTLRCRVTPSRVDRTPRAFTHGSVAGFVRTPRVARRRPSRVETREGITSSQGTLFSSSAKRKERSCPEAPSTVVPRFGLCLTRWSVRTSKRRRPSRAER